MAKIVKIPLVMKNGEKATDMKSLKENFDTESVIGYFLDGKLGKWLNDRYYEDEAEAVAQFSKDDPQLAKKLCEIFDAEYEENEVIDAEEIARRNERIARLKQLTDDEEVLRDIDSVAFDQEELAELYDQGVEKIYLCEGDFKIPKSKQGLEYVVLFGAAVNGLLQESKPQDEKKLTPTSNTEISVELADELCFKNYAISPKHVVKKEHNTVIQIDKATKMRETIKSKHFESSLRAPVKLVACTENFLLLEYIGFGSGLFLYDLNRRTKKNLPPTTGSYSFFDTKILRANSYEGTVIDIETGTTEDISFGQKLSFDQLLLTPFGLYLGLSSREADEDEDEEDDETDSSAVLYHYDLATKITSKVCDLEDDGFHIHHMEYFGGNVYIIGSDDEEDYSTVTIYRVSCTETNPAAYEMTSERMDDTHQLKCSMPYIVFRKNDCTGEIFSFNVQTGECVEVGCGIADEEFDIVGKYLYFYKQEQDEDYNEVDVLCRKNLADFNEKEQEV